MSDPLCTWLYTVNREIFARVLFPETSHIKSSQNGEIILSFTGIDKSCPSREFQTSQIYLLTPFEKIKFSRKFSRFTAVGLAVYFFLV